MPAKDRYHDHVRNALTKDGWTITADPLKLKMNDLYAALGQFILYREALLQSEPARQLYLAIRQPIFESLFTGSEGESLRKREQLKLIVFDAKKQEILQWIE